jgi:energy-coupling factor transport system substrate-specific component
VGRATSALIYLASSSLGLLAFLYPFLLPEHPSGARGVDAPLVTAALVALALLALLLDLQGQALSARTVATLGVLVAINAVLRFVEVAIPGPGGFTPMFAPLILAAYVFGARFGFLLGAFTLLASALITGGVGPWLPYQMFAAGWMGLSAGALGLARARLGRARRLEMAALGLLGLAWGFLYGAIMNLYAWPFTLGAAEQSWSAGIGPGETIGRYAVFYLATSFWWDVAGAIGNLLLILALAPSLVPAFGRFHRRAQVAIESGS